MVQADAHHHSVLSHRRRSYLRRLLARGRLMPDPHPFNSPSLLFSFWSCCVLWVVLILWEICVVSCCVRSMFVEGRIFVIYVYGGRILCCFCGLWFCVVVILHHVLGQYKRNDMGVIHLSSGRKKIIYLEYGIWRRRRRRRKRGV